MAMRLPRPLARRDILYGPDTPRQSLLELAEAYLQEGLTFDAADFFAQARDRDGLSHIRKLAIEAGDAFLLRRVQEAEGSLVSTSDWKELARCAREHGKEVYAERAEAGGTPPAHPLQEEAKLEEGAEAGEKGGTEGGADAARDAAGGDGPRRGKAGGGSPQKAGRDRRRQRRSERQGG